MADITRFVVDYRALKGRGTTSSVTTSADRLSHRHPKRANRWRMGREGDIFSDSSSFIEWWVNPNECQWKVATRTMIEKVGGGAIHHEWPQTGMTASFNRSRFDQPVLSLSFQSGIITIGGYNDILSGNVGGEVPAGLGNFFDFLELLDRPNVKDDGSPNYVQILYRTPIFGDRGIWLQGFFTEDGVSWTDNADSPNTISAWGASFIVYNSTPKLNRLRECFTTLGVQ